ncbi:MAG: Cof-type HAD-IIB family hydrolase [Bacilli bacterium]|nr:Cof-type HAD-IIB family hydrolase [Bacilli bacterium]
MSKLLAVDLDGTLFYPKRLTRRIPKKNVAFLRKWIDAGNKVVLISSRSNDFMQKLNKEIKRPVDMVCHLGAQIRINDELVRDVCIDKNHLKTVLEEIKANYKTLSYMICTEDLPMCMRGNKDLNAFTRFFYKFWYFFQGKYKEKYVVDNKVFEDLLANSRTFMARILFGVKKKNSQVAKELNKKLRERFPDIEFSWTDIIIEMSPAGCTKSDSLDFYVEKTGFKKEDVYVVGDSGNDITMFQEYYEHSYCMAHSYSSVKKYAKNVISRVHNLDKLVLEGENK